MSERDELAARAQRQLRAAIAGDGDRRMIAALIDLLESLANTDVERARWRRWREAVNRGGRLKIGTYTAEVFVDDDLEALEQARRMLADPEEFNAAVPRPGNGG